MNTSSMPSVESKWSLADYLGAIAVRWGFRRMNYRVNPGLYAVGSADADAPVFVTANYKPSFDCVRRALAGMNAWILVLDTHGVNVWCAAGKGTFGTKELVHRINTHDLANRIAHRRLILPQLGAPGVSAHEIKKQTGFTVVYGPVRAADISEFMKSGGTATTEMRRVTFRWRERLAVAPIEWVIHFRKMFFAGLILAVLCGISSQGYTWPSVWHVGGHSFLLCLITYLCAGFMGPLLLPWLPSRAFSIKGAFLGALLAGFGLWWVDWSATRSIAWVLLVTAGTSYLLLNFTGSTTFTSPSGARREVRAALPLQGAAGAAGLVFWIMAGFI